SLFAKVDRGDYEASLQTLSRAIHQAQADGQVGEAAAEALPRAARLALVESYYQKLAQAGQYEVAKKAFALLSDAARDPAAKALAANRMDRLQRVGQPAPEIAGLDVDGQKVSLQGLKGDVVLVVFWTTWAVPSAAEVGRLEEIYEAHKADGFRVLGINVDSLQAGGPDPSTTLSLVRRFLLDYNVPWPTLVNGPGNADYAGLYGVKEVPSDFLVNRDGKIIAVDLTGSALEAAVTKALKP
ncbi:MAG TPA: TlpA disulfide reductase family protein, partial [Isosphaeraceae bacterium]|nr:TlpA disulfide reductase family protein [Isosphaeraceae bacterium]